MEREVSGLITSEDPSVHWSFLPTEGKTILDLGCGINNQEHLPTPMYWLEKKAKKVIGVDPSLESYNWFKQNFNVKNFINVKDFVDRIEKFELYLGYYKPDVAKIDIEGGELYLNGLDPKYLENTRHIGIEYHSFPCLVSCERLFQDNGYDIKYYKFNHIDIDHQGVIYGHKKSITYKQRTI
jgi:SAM-dependent methyltransferase